VERVSHPQPALGGNLAGHLEEFELEDRPIAPTCQAPPFDGVVGERPREQSGNGGYFARDGLADCGPCSRNFSIVWWKRSIFRRSAAGKAASA